MPIVSLAERSTFFRIYAGLLLVCALVAFFAYYFVNSINEARLQNYRENLASGVFYLISEGVARQDEPVSRAYWLSDAANLSGYQFEVVPFDSLRFKAKELARLDDKKSVVRYDEAKSQALVYQRIGTEDNVLAVRVNQVGERQVRALSVFLQEELSHYPDQISKQSRLDSLSNHFGYELNFYAIGELELDNDHLTRLELGDPVILFEDGVISQSSSLTVVMPSGFSGQVIVVGPVPLFNWFPLNLLASMAVICILLISLGVFALIFPLERRLQLLQIGVNRVAEGKLDTKVQVVGHDDIARLSATFNVMTTHIQRLIESQRELTRAVSHELRTPVARIRFAVDMLADEDDYETRQAQRNHIDADIESLNELIDEILTYAKLEEGSPKMNWEMVNFKALLEQILKETNALGKDIRINIITPNPKTVVMADRRYLHRVVQNLVGNALRYANTVIVISAWVKSGHAFVAVEDDGPGIPEADREKVFIPFARLDDSRTRMSGGYGLGLSIVSRIAFWFGGSMRVDASPSLGGARFVMTWPAKQLGVTVLADDIVNQKMNEKIIGEDERY